MNWEYRQKEEDKIKKMMKEDPRYHEPEQMNPILAIIITAVAFFIGAMLIRAIFS